MEYTLGFNVDPKSGRCGLTANGDPNKGINNAAIFVLVTVVQCSS